MKTSYVKEVFENATKAAREHAYKKVGDNVMIYPCGFAWVELKVKKNNKLGKELEKEEMMMWDPISKSYKHWVAEYNQSMLHKEAHAEKMAQILFEELFELFEAKSRLD